MAKIRKNAVVQGASGKFGDMIVFRQLPDGRTILTQAPGSNPNRKPSEAQVAQQKVFQQAILYGKNALADDASRQIYEEASKKNPRLSAFNVAVADFAKAPSIDEIDVSGYNGQAGDKILVMASDDFMVKEVKATIYNPDGTIADEGMAVADKLTPNRWVWTAKNTNETVAGDKIVVSASDIPGKIAKVEEELV
jgi:hypothetical protein